MKAALEKVTDHVQARVSSIRHPETGEFPTVVVTTAEPTGIQIAVEGSKDLSALVNERLANQGVVDRRATDGCQQAGRPPVVFLSYAWEDSDLASKIAHVLMENGIETWWAGWSMRAGDSMPQKINEGLGECTHFVVLLTPVSMTKSWVKLEMDAGLVRKIADKCVFITLRHDVPAKDLPPLLAIHLSPELADPDHDLDQLVSDIHGITRKPPLGKAPMPVMARPINTGYSPAAVAVARVFVKATMYGLWGDPQRELGQVAADTGLTLEDVTDAVHELSSMTEVHHTTVLPKAEMFAAFDKHFTDRDPEQDAVRLATDMVNDLAFPSKPADIAKRLGWAPRRLNPAIAYLETRRLIDTHHGLDESPWGSHEVSRTDATRRFVKSRQ